MMDIRMDERINKIIQGFDEIYNKIKDLKLYNDIFNIFTEKLKKEFRRKECIQQKLDDTSFF